MTEPKHRTRIPPELIAQLRSPEAREQAKAEVLERAKNLTPEQKSRIERHYKP